MHTECKLCVHSKKSMCACSRFQHSNKSRRTAHKCTYTHASMLVWILRAEQMDWNQIRFLCIHSSFPFFFSGATLLRHTGERMNVNIWWTDDEYSIIYMCIFNILIIKYVARLPMFMIQKWFFHVFQTQRTGNTKKMYRSIQLHQSKCNIHTIIQWGKWFVFVVHGFNHRDRRNHSNKLSSFNQNLAINLWWWIAKKLGCTFLHQWRRPFRHFFVSSQMFLFLE